MNTKKTDIVEKTMVVYVVDTPGDPTKNSDREQGMDSEEREERMYGTQKKSPHPDLENLITEAKEEQGSTQSEDIARIRDDRMTRTGPRDGGDHAVHNQCAQLTVNLPDKNCPNHPHRKGESTLFGDGDRAMPTESEGRQVSPVMARLDSHVSGPRKVSEKVHEPPRVADITTMTSCGLTRLDGPQDSTSVRVVKAGSRVATREHLNMNTGAVIPASSDDEAASVPRREASSTRSLALPLARVLSRDRDLQDVAAPQVIDSPGRHAHSSTSPQHRPWPSNRLSQFEACLAPPANRIPQRTCPVEDSELPVGTDVAKGSQSKTNQAESRPAASATEADQRRRHQAAIKIQAHARGRVASKRLANMRLANGRGGGTVAVDGKKRNYCAPKAMNAGSCEKSQTIPTKQHVPGLCIASSTAPQSSSTGAAKRVAQEPLAILRQLRDHPGSKPRAEESEFRLRATVRSAIEAHVRKTGAMRRKARPLPTFPDWSLSSNSRSTMIGPQLRGIRTLPPRKPRSALLPQQHNQQGRLLTAISSMNKRRPRTSSGAAASRAYMTRLPNALAAP